MQPSAKGQKIRLVAPAPAACLALGIMAAVGLIAVLIVHCTGAALRYVPPDALELTVAEGRFI